MNSTLSQDVSLYELALDSEPLLAPLQVSPSTLKSVISSTIDLLIDRKISATLWVKLPRDAAWQAEIKRYCESVERPESIYIFTQHRDETPEDPLSMTEPSGLHASTGSAKEEGTQLNSPGIDPASWWVQQSSSSPKADLSLVSDAGLVVSPRTAHPAIVPLYLTTDSQLRREYFLVVVSPQFSSLIVAHRPRTMRQARGEESKAGQQVALSKAANPRGEERQNSEAELRHRSATNKMGGLLEDGPPERKHPLLTLCSCDRRTIQRVLTGLQEAIALNHISCGSEPSSVDHRLDAGVSPCDWPQLLPQESQDALDPSLVSHLLMKQIQRQEEIWHRTTTYRKQAEVSESLHVQNEELQHGIRLKDELLSNVGQELRTPLTNMKTALTLLNSPNLKPAQRQRYMQLLSTECDRQSSLINSLLELVQLDRDAENANLQAVSLKEIVPGVVSTYQPLAQEKGIMLAYTVPDNLPPISCLNTWLKQIVIHLLHNGIKFTPTGGQVWVRAKPQGEYVQLEFKDTGIGIPTSEIPKIFDRFYRVRHVAGEDPGGAGLGLTLVREILARCGGSVSVKSKLGEGTTFNVLLPVHHPKGQAQ